MFSYIVPSTYEPVAAIAARAVHWMIKRAVSVGDRNPLVITYDDNDSHLANFKGRNIYRHDVFCGGRHVWGKELIITNYEIPYWEMIDGELELVA